MALPLLKGNALHLGQASSILAVVLTVNFVNAISSFLMVT